MSCCARCGEGICTTSGKITLNKVWHRNCFCCFNCNCPLDVSSAKIFYGEVFCKSCYQQLDRRDTQQPEITCPSTPTIKRCTSPPPPPPKCCMVRDTHSCSCLPPPPPCRQCPPKPILCCPKSPKPLNYPPRTQSPCQCQKCCANHPLCKNEPNDQLKMRFCEARSKFQCNNTCTITKKCFGVRCCGEERCQRCKERVFAAEKVATSCGPYHFGCFTCYCCCKSLCVKTMYEASGEIFCRNCYNTYFGINGYGNMLV